jgi:hypothetical protein
MTWQQIFNALPEKEDLFPLWNYLVAHPLLDFPQ